MHGLEQTRGTRTPQHTARGTHTLVMKSYTREGNYTGIHINIYKETTVWALLPLAGDLKTN